MNPYITFRDTDENGQLQYYILQRSFPHYIGRIAGDFQLGGWQSPIAGHRLAVVFDGTLRGRTIPSYQNVSKEIEDAMNTMAMWYYNNRVLKEPSKYKKFKINV